MNIQIDYNTISFESQIYCNDKTIQSNLKQTIINFKDRRITDWFETFVSRVKEECNNDSFSVKIIGCDFYEKIFIESVLEKNESFIDKSCIEYLEDKMVENNYKMIDDFLDFAIKSEELLIRKAIKPAIDKIKFLRGNIVEVPVIATMSSGKSTLLNALIGQDFLFEDTGTATATTCTIKVNNNLNNFIAQAFNEEKLIKETKNDIRDFLRNWNSSANDKHLSKLRLKIEGPIQEFNASTFELHFIDTPGPNSAKYENHKDNLYFYLKDNQKLPIVLYVLDPEKMDSNDDNDTLKEIGKTLKDNKQNLDRIIFIYNKVDREDLEKKSLDSILQKVTNFLKNYGIFNPKIFPVSAHYAKLAQLSNNLSRKEINDLKSYQDMFAPNLEAAYSGYQLLEHSPLPKHLKDQLKNNLSKNKLNADIVYSGLAAVKIYIEDYIINHHKKYLYKDLMGIAYNIYEEIEDKINLKKHSLKERTDDELKKNQERTRREKEILVNTKKEALQAIGLIVPNTNFIDAAFTVIDSEFSILQNKILKRDTLNRKEAEIFIEKSNDIISNLRVGIETDLISKMNDELVDFLKRSKREIVDKFDLESPSLETKAFNAELFNKINVFDINNLDNYETTKIEYKEREVEKEETSRSWFKRIFGLKDKIIITEYYEVEKKVISAAKLLNDFVDPMSKQIHDLVIDFISEFDEIICDYKESFENLVESSFKEAIDSVFDDSQRVSALSIKDKEIQFQILDEIINTISKFKIKEYNEKIHRKQAIAC